MLDQPSSPPLPRVVNGVLTTGQSYKEVIRYAVRAKWPDQEQKTWWYSKLTMVRRIKLEKLYREQEGRCYFCHEPTWMAERGVDGRRNPGGRRKEFQATLEHRTPQVQGGTDHPSNLVMSCHGCNTKRREENFEYFLSIRLDPVKWKAYNSKQGRKVSANHRARQKKSADRLEQRIKIMAILIYLRSYFG